VETEVGTIEAGKRADLTVLSEDPTAIDPERLDEVEVARTYIGGRLVFEAPSSTPASGPAGPLRESRT
jgi:predicted amidohydrolase YtcJ